MFQSLGLSPGVAALIVTVVIANLGNSIIAPVMPAIKDEFMATAGEVGLVASGFGLGRLAMDLPAGYLTDRVSASRLFVAGIVLTGVAAVLAATSTTLQQLILFRTAMGVGSAIMSTVALALLARMARPDQRGSVLSLYTSAMLLGHAFSPTIGGYLALLFDWRAAFVFCAVTPCLALPLNILAASRVPEARHSRAASQAESVQDPAPANLDAARSDRPRNWWRALAAVYFASFLTYFNRQGMRQSLLPLYGGMVLGMNPGTIGIILTLASFFTIVLNLPSGVVGDRIGRRQMLLLGMLIICAGNVSLLAGGGSEVYIISTVLISMGVMSSSMLSGLVADLVPESLVGQGMGMFRFTGDLGFVLGPFVLGLLLDNQGFAAASIFGACVILLGAITVLALVPSQTTSKDPAPATQSGSR